MSVYRAIIDEGLDIAGQPSGGDFETMFKRAANRYYRRLLAMVNQDDERREFSLTTVAGTSKYGMPLYVKSVLNIEDATNNRSIVEMTPEEYDKLHPGTTSTGPPEKYYAFGRFGVQAQPSSSAQLSIASDAAGDSGNRYVRVSGFSASGVWITERVTLTGTTTAQTVSTFSAIESLAKSADDGYSITGNITVTDGTDTLAVIPVPVDAPRYEWIEFYPTPDSALTLTVRAIMRKPDLANDDDLPQMDEDFHGLLVSGPLSELLPALGKNTLAGVMLREYQGGVKEFKSAQQRRPNRPLVFADVTTGARASDKAIIGTLDGVSVL